RAYQHPQFNEFQQYARLPPQFHDESSQFIADPNDDLPPHFAMESGELGEMYDSTELQGYNMAMAVNDQRMFDDHNILKTPEPVQPTQLDEPKDFTSPPRPWEAAARAGHPQTPPPHGPPKSQQP